MTASVRAPSWWHLAEHDELAGSPDELWSGEVEQCTISLATTAHGVWLMAAAPSGARIAVRAAYSPGPLTVQRVRPMRDGCALKVATTLGVQSISVRLDGEDGVVSFRTVLSPGRNVDVPAWPRDIVPIGNGRAHPRGIVHTQQRGLRTGLVHATVHSPGPLSFMYLQDLTTLAEYCDRTKASPADTVGGSWPDIGFRLPAGERSLQRSDGSLTISCGHLAFAEGRPHTPAAVAEQYLDLLERLYFHLERPTPPFTDWLDHAEKARADLERCADCWSELDGTRYLRAYVGDDTHPPESMVQLAVAVPLLERQRWSGRKDRLASSMLELLPDFFDERIDSLTRWLPTAEDQLTGDEPHERAPVMDSWYLFHPLLNLARLAAWGEAEARRIFFASLPTAIKVAHRFKYHWPVFYDVKTLRVIQAETKPGAGGEQDVAGLYAHVMLQAWDLSGEQQYLDEAIAAGHSLIGRGFELTYQMNNVTFGMEAMLRLFQITGDPRFRGVEHVLAACLLDNVGLWQCCYGDAGGRSTFIGVYPLADAPYTAAYEEAEVAAGALAYLRRAGDDVHPALRVLLAELVRHTTARLPEYFPSNLPDRVIADRPKTGHIDASLRLPLEDVGDGWSQAGTVGQEIYGAGMAFSTVVRSYVRVCGPDIYVYCDYPVSIVTQDEYTLRMRVIGDPRLDCRVRVDTANARRHLAAHIVAGSESGPLEPHARAQHFAEYQVAAGQDLFVSFEAGTSRRRRPNR